MDFNEEQTSAINIIKEWASGKGPGLISLTGKAGSGKTTILMELKKFIEDAQYCAMTGRAALRLSDVAEVKAKTLHSCLYKKPDQLKSGELEFKTLSTPTSKYLVIDEAGMITPKIFDDLKQWVYYYKTRILFIGDSFQLPPILSDEDKKNDGNFSIFSYIKGPELIKVMRSDNGIIDIATIIRDERRIPIDPNKEYSVIQISDPLTYAVNEYLADPNDHMVITWRNKMRMEANHMIRQKLGYTHYLPDEGELICFCRNGSGVLNGEIVRIKKIMPDIIIEGIITYKVLLEDGRKILCSVQGRDDQMDGLMPTIKNWGAYLKAKRKYKIEDPIPISYGYCSTAHRSQGNEFRRVSIMLQGSDINNIHFRAQTILPDKSKAPFGIRFLYTAISRAKEKAMLIIGV